jgi:inorganic pyrophosphatase
MANINHKPSKYMLNLLHVLPPFANEADGVINAIVEVSAGSINKYEIITETGQLKLDRVGYSSLAYPSTKDPGTKGSVIFTISTSSGSPS